MDQQLLEYFIYAFCMMPRVFVIVLLADLAIAFAHHLMDNFGDPGCCIKWLARIFERNRLHHSHPQDLLKKSPWANAAETIVIGFVILILAWIFGSLSWEVWLFSLVVAVSAVVHRWQHMPTTEVPWLFDFMRRCGLVQARRQHMEHHRLHNVNYAVITNCANWVLERTRFFRLVEWLLERFGRRPYDLKQISHDERKARGKRIDA